MFRLLEYLTTEFNMSIMQIKISNYSWLCGLILTARKHIFCIFKSNIAYNLKKKKNLNIKSNNENHWLASSPSDQQQPSINLFHAAPDAQHREQPPVHTGSKQELLPDATDTSRHPQPSQTLHPVNMCTETQLKDQNLPTVHMHTTRCQIKPKNKPGCSSH